MAGLGLSPVHLTFTKLTETDTGELESTVNRNTGFYYYFQRMTILLSILFLEFYPNYINVGHLFGLSNNKKNNQDINTKISNNFLG